MSIVKRLKTIFSVATTVTGLGALTLDVQFPLAKDSKGRFYAFFARTLYDDGGTDVGWHVLYVIEDNEWLYDNGVEEVPLTSELLETIEQFFVDGQGSIDSESKIFLETRVQNAS